MKKRRRSALWSFSVVVVLAAGYLLYPCLQREVCARELAQAEDFPELHELLLGALIRDSEAWDGMIAAFAEENPLVLFDRRHRMLLIHDPDEKLLWKHMTSPGYSTHRLATGELVSVPVPPAELSGVGQRFYRDRSNMGETIVFSELICVECSDERAIHVYRCADGYDYRGLPFHAEEFLFRNTEFGFWQNGGGKIFVDDDLITKWKEAGTWPPDWPQSIAGQIDG